MKCQLSRSLSPKANRHCLACFSSSVSRKAWQAVVIAAADRTWLFVRASNREPTTSRASVAAANLRMGILKFLGVSVGE